MEGQAVDWVLWMQIRCSVQLTTTGTHFDFYSCQAKSVGFLYTLLHFALASYYKFLMQTNLSTFKIIIHQLEAQRQGAGFLFIGIQAALFGGTLVPRPSDDLSDYNRRVPFMYYFFIRRIFSLCLENYENFVLVV